VPVTIKGEGKSSCLLNNVRIDGVCHLEYAIRRQSLETSDVTTDFFIFWILGCTTKTIFVTTLYKINKYFIECERGRTGPRSSFRIVTEETS
jgi:hypothetical protein